MEKKKKSKISRGEDACRAIMADLFPGHKSVKIRPDWLKNPATGRNLELDCYYPTLSHVTWVDGQPRYSHGIAIEYNGKYHYKFSRKYHGKKAELLALQQRDLLKQQLCSQLGVKLVIVPYWEQGRLELVIRHQLA